MEHPFLMFLDHTQRSTTVGRTPLDEKDIPVTETKAFSRAEEWRHTFLTLLLGGGLLYFHLRQNKF